MEAAPIRAEPLSRAARRLRQGGSLSLVSFGPSQPQYFCTAAESPSAGRSPCTSTPTLPEVTSSVCAITHTLGARSGCCPHLVGLPELSVR